VLCNVDSEAGLFPCWPLSSPQTDAADARTRCSAAAPAADFDGEVDVCGTASSCTSANVACVQ